MAALIDAAKAPDYPAAIVSGGVEPSRRLGPRARARGRHRDRAGRSPDVRHGPRSFRARARRHTRRPSDRSRLPCRLHAAVDAMVRHPLERPHAQYPSGVACRRSKACTPTAARSRPAPHVTAPPSISSPSEMDAGPIILQEAVPVLRRRYRRDAVAPRARSRTPASTRRRCAGWPKAGSLLLRMRSAATAKTKSPRGKTGGHQNCFAVPVHATFRFSAEVLPRLVTSSYSTS